MNKPIKASDDNALEDLMAKAKMLREKQEDMKKANAYFRKNCSMRGYEDWTDAKADKMDIQIQNAYSFNKQPYPSYTLQNNSQNLRATEQRVKTLEREQTSAPKEYDTEKYGFEVYEDKELMRLQLFFEGKPEEKIREQLKERGFHWTPSKECWQRQLTDNARYSLSGFIRTMEKQQNQAKAEIQ